MDKPTATKIIRDTFEQPFNKAQYTLFVKELFNHLTETPETVYQGNLIPNAFKGYVHSLQRIGKYIDTDNKKIEVLMVRLAKETSLERARTMQRNFIAWYLDGSRGGVLKDAALVAFYTDELEDWRFSLVKMEYRLTPTEKGIKAEEELTPARRYSFLVGKYEPNHTAQQQLVPLLIDDQHNPTLAQFESAFNIESVTKEFFTKYRELFLELKESLDEMCEHDKVLCAEFLSKQVDIANFAKKLLGQIVFLYFLQKKGWLGVPRGKDWGAGDRKFLRTLFVRYAGNKKNFFNDCLEYLFYDALNNLNRGGTDPSYYPRFDCKIPFLNGGLFEPIQNYDWQKTHIILPNELFSNSDRTDQGDIGTGILDIFDRYNFTVKEDEPLDKEVAIDPEMLGKVFENLLEVKDRKSKGTYYTPREIVHYMCQESLINYLATELSSVDITNDTPVVIARSAATKQSQLPTKEDIETFIRYGEFAIENDLAKELGTKTYTYKMPESIRQNAELIDEKLANIRICDPAIGSGAFPVGMMHEIVRARTVLTTYLQTSPDVIAKDAPPVVIAKNASCCHCEERSDEAISKPGLLRSVRNDKMMTEPVSQSRTAYNFKRHAIQNCLYGVDI
ncbi:MAG: class I SAM-dependent DNA methyltransferase, partial [bacterium]|nr:class I SAM-dependent DNA methyltransferase [bacterium]